VSPRAKKFYVWFIIATLIIAFLAIDLVYLLNY